MLDFLKGLFSGEDDKSVKVFMDIDGVLYPTYARNLGELGYKRVEGRYGQWFLHDMHGEWLRELHDAGVSITWETSWAEEANEFVNPHYDLPEFPFIDYAKESLNHHALKNDDLTFKLPFIAKRAKNNPVVIIDDDLESDVYKWKQKRKFPTLVVEPDPRIGLTESQMEHVREFVRRNQPS